MKIAPKSVDSFLASPHKEYKAVLVYGVDNGLVRERADIIIKNTLGKDAGDSFAKLELSEAELLADPVKLADELSAFSMMCSKRIIMIRDAGDKLSKIIESAESFFNKDNFLLVVAGDLPSKSSLRTLFEKHNQCALIACYRDEARDIGAIIRKKFEESAIKYERDVIEYLVGQLGNDRYVTYQELDKLVIYAGDEKRLTLQDVQLLVDYNQDTKLDDVVHAVADRNLVLLEKAINQHLREGVMPIAYLRAMQRYFNRLYSIRVQMNENRMSAEMVIAGLRPPVFFKQQPILIRHVNYWTSQNIMKALKLLITAELVCKTSDLPMVAASSRELLKITQIR